MFTVRVNCNIQFVGELVSKICLEAIV